MRLEVDRMVSAVVDGIKWPFRAGQNFHENVRPGRLRWVAASIIGVVVFAAIAIWFYSLGIKFWADKDHSETIRNYGLLVAAFGAGALAVWRSVINRKQANTAEQGQITDRYTEAVKMLSDEKTRTRVGAVYALARIAQDSVERDHIPVMEVLCEFLRNPPYATEAAERADELRDRADKLRDTIEKINTGAIDYDDVAFPPAIQCPDILAALNVIAGRSRLQREFEKSVEFVLNLERASFHDLDLEDAKLENLQLRRAVFKDANLRAADLRDADLRNAHLEGADLQGADLQRAKFQGAGLQGADLKCAKLMGANLEGADLLFAENLTNDQIESCRAGPRPRNLREVLTWPYIQNIAGRWIRRED